MAGNSSRALSRPRLCEALGLQGQRHHPHPCPARRSLSSGDTDVKAEYHDRCQVPRAWGGGGREVKEDFTGEMVLELRTAHRGREKRSRWREGHGQRPRGRGSVAGGLVGLEPQVCVGGEV